MAPKVSTKWISVTQDLPDIDKDLTVFSKEVFCLVIDEPCGEEPELCIRRGIYSASGNWYVDGEQCFKVTHWLPIPEFPVFSLQDWLKRYFQEKAWVEQQFPEEVQA